MKEEVGWATTKRSDSPPLAPNARGPFALSAQLRPLLQEGTDPRIIWTASSRVGYINFDDLQKERGYEYGPAYDNTKLGTLLMAFECERRSKANGWGITSIATHPGVSRTNIVLDGPGLDTPEGWRFQYVRPMWQDPATGALPAPYAATSPQATGGGYYGPKQLRGLSGLPGLPSSRIVLTTSTWPRDTGQLWRNSPHSHSAEVPENADDSL